MDILLLLVLGFLQLVDVVSTDLAIGRGAFEKNKLIVLSMRHFGRFWFLPKLGIALGALMVLSGQRENHLFYLFALGVIAVYLAVIRNNYRLATR